MSAKVDGNYDYTKPWRAPVQPDQVAKRWTYNGPWASNMERLTQQALMVATIPGQDISAMVRPPLPQIALFPDRYGYDRRQPGIEDIVTIDRNYVEPRISWYSGGPGGYAGASRNSLAGS
jgi:hypothetical protein